MSDDGIQGRIARGIAVLDTERPDWRASINLPSLNVGDNRLCPLGQVYGGWNGALDILWPDAMPFQQVRRAIDCGFEADDDADYADLTEAWVEALTEEQA